MHDFAAVGDGCDAEGDGDVASQPKLRPTELFGETLGPVPPAIISEIISSPMHCIVGPNEVVGRLDLVLEFNILV